MIKLLALVLALAACGGTKPDKGTGPDGTGGGSGATSGGGDGSATAVTADDAITLEACDTMIEHILDLGIAELPAEKRPPPEKIAEIKAKPLTESDKKNCAAFPKSNYDCIMAATTAAALES